VFIKCGILYVIHVFNLIPTARERSFFSLLFLADTLSDELLATVFIEILLFHEQCLVEKVANRAEQDYCQQNEGKLQCQGHIL